MTRIHLVGVLTSLNSASQSKATDEVGSNVLGTTASMIRINRGRHVLREIHHHINHYSKSLFPSLISISKFLECFSETCFGLICLVRYYNKFVNGLFKKLIKLQGVGKHGRARGIIHLALIAINIRAILDMARDINE